MKFYMKDRVTEIRGENGKVKADFTLCAFSLTCLIIQESQ